MAVRNTFQQKLLRIACAMLLVVLGFAHKPLQAHASAPMDLSAYVLPDGSIADICFSDHIRTMPAKHGGASSCEACRLSAGGLLPLPPTSATTIVLIESAAIFLTPSAVVRTTERRSGTSPRGPPIGHVSA